MGALGDYFAAIGRTIVSLGDGLAVTGSYLLRKPVTLQYPDRTPEPVVAMLPERSRGLLEVDLDLCTGCALCEKTCPISCIKIEVSKGKERQVTRFDIDLGKCMHCGLCEECCPTQGIRHTREFEGGMYNPDLLYMHFVERPQPVAKPAKKGEPEPAKNPVGAVLRRLLTDAWGKRTKAQLEASAAAIAAAEAKTKAAAAAAAAAVAAASAKAAAAATAAAKTDGGGGGEDPTASTPTSSASAPAAGGADPAEGNRS